MSNMYKLKQPPQAEPVPGHNIEELINGLAWTLDENGEQVDVDSLEQHFGCPKTGGNLHDVAWIRRIRHLVGFAEKIL